MKAIFLVGLCGSGKSRLASQMKKKGYEWVEGFVGDPKQFGVLVEHLKAGKDCVGEELQTIRAEFREELTVMLTTYVPGVEVEFWFFENDLARAADNVRNRPDDVKPVAAHLDLNERVSLVYDIPPGAKILSIEPPTPYEG